MLDRVLRADNTAAQQRAQKLMQRLELCGPEHKDRFLLNNWTHAASGNIGYEKPVGTGSRTNPENTHTQIEWEINRDGKCESEESRSGKTGIYQALGERTANDKEKNVLSYMTK